MRRCKLVKWGAAAVTGMASALTHRNLMWSFSACWWATLSGAISLAAAAHYVMRPVPVSGRFSTVQYGSAIGNSAQSAFAPRTQLTLPDGRAGRTGIGLIYSRSVGRSCDAHSPDLSATDLTSIADAGASWRTIVIAQLAAQGVAFCSACYCGAVGTDMNTGVFRRSFPSDRPSWWRVRERIRRGHFAQRDRMKAIAVNARYASATSPQQDRRNLLAWYRGAAVGLLFGFAAQTPCHLRRLRPELLSLKVAPA